MYLKRPAAGDGRGLALPYFLSIAAFSACRGQGAGCETPFPGGLPWAVDLVRAAQVLLTGASFLKRPSDGTRHPAQGNDGHHCFLVYTDPESTSDSKKHV